MVLLGLISTCSVTVSAKSNDESIGRAYIYKPTVNVEVYGVNEDVNECKVRLGNGQLTVLGSEQYDSNVHKTAVYLLIDTSSANKQFGKFKSALCNYVDKLSSNDQLTLMTFGDKVSDSVTYDSCNSATKSKIKKAINNVSCSDKSALLYDALQNAYNDSVMENDEFDRRYAIVASAGENQKNSSGTYSQVKNLYESHMLPMFAFAGKNSDDTEDLSNICSLSGGNLYTYSSSNGNSVVNSFNNHVNKNVLLIKAQSKTNYSTSGKKVLDVKLDGKSVTPISIVANSLTDNEAPTASVTFAEDNYYKFTVDFSEKVKDADDYSKYIITNDGEECEVKEVRKVNDTKYVIVMQEPISSGKYDFKFEGITDNSVQRNPVESLTGVDISSSQYIIDNVIFYGLIALGSIVVIGLAIFLVIKLKKKQKILAIEREKQVIEHISGKNKDVQHLVEFEEAPGIKIQMTVSKPGSAGQVINTKVSGSLIVGRADICDICIDDNQMSRQHFVFQENNNNIIITDLETLNGTFVNTFKLTSPQILKNGDEIIAGSCRIKFYYRNGE